LKPQQLALLVVLEFISYYLGRKGRYLIGISDVNISSRSDEMNLAGGVSPRIVSVFDAGRDG